MRYCNPQKNNQPTKAREIKEISKGTLGSVMRYTDETIFEFYKSNIDKRKKLKEEMNAIINSYKEHKINEGILKIKSINPYMIITEPVIDSISNLHHMNFKGFEIFRIFLKFNEFIKYCLDKKINLSNLKLCDIYLTKNYELKLLSINYDTEILHKIKREKFSDIHNNKNNISYLIGTIMYYLYYNEYPKKNETKFPAQKHFKELVKYCLNANTKFDYDEYINHTFFHPDIIFPNNTKNNIKLFDKYSQYTPSNSGYMSPDIEELYYVKTEYNSIYSSFDGRKILEVEKSSEPSFFKLKSEKNKNIYIIIFSHNTFILKKNNNNFSVIQEIKLNNFLELSNGDLAVITYNKINIYSKNSEDKFDIKFILSDIKAEFLFETDENYLSVMGREKSALYDIKNYQKLKENKDIKEIYLNEKIKIKNYGNESIIYHGFFEDEILKINETFLCVTKKADGTYLIGGYKNHIYQIYFDKYGFPELISKVDTGYGYYEDDLSGDCIYSYSSSRYYSVGFIEEFQNGNILTVSDFCQIKKFWRY